MAIVWGDTETGSKCDLKSAGGYRYAADKSTKIQLFSYALEDGPVKLWDLYSGERVPADLKEYLLDPQYIWTFHNAQFDRLIIKHCLKIDIPVERFRCSMAQAMSHALPGSLEKCGEILGIREDARKLKDGKKLMMLFCKPNPRTGFWANPKSHPDEWARYKEYCINDTAAMREITKKMPKWNYPSGNELALWHLDQKINDRGMYIDLDMVNAAVSAIEKEKAILASRTQKLTDNEVQAASQRDVLMKYLIETFGIELPDMRKVTMAKLLDNDNLPDALRELLEVRLSTCTSSTAKYNRLLKATGEDSRLRGTIMYAGAGRTSRDCLAEGTRILIMDSRGEVYEKVIEQVSESDLVWDGFEWVAHEGVICKGDLPTIEHDGICATPDHMVYLEDGKSVRLEEAKRLELKLWRSPPKDLPFTK